MDFAPDVTPRGRFSYVSCGFNHTMNFRVARGTSVSDGAGIMRTAAGGLAAALEALLPVDFAFTDFAYALEDEDVFTGGFTLPTQPTGVKVVATYTPMMRGTATTFQGIGGQSKVKVAVFGVFWDPSDVAGPAANGKVSVGESADVDAAVGALNASSGLRSIFNAAITWKNYATVKPNDHYVGLARKLFT